MGLSNCKRKSLIFGYILYIYPILFTSLIQQAQSALEWKFVLCNLPINLVLNTIVPVILILLILEIQISVCTYVHAFIASS